MTPKFPGMSRLRAECPYEGVQADLEALRPGQLGENHGSAPRAFSGAFPECAFDGVGLVPSDYSSSGQLENASELKRF